MKKTKLVAALAIFCAGTSLVSAQSEITPELAKKITDKEFKRSYCLYDNRVFTEGTRVDQAGTIMVCTPKYSEREGGIVSIWKQLR